MNYQDSAFDWFTIVLSLVQIIAPIWAAIITFGLSKETRKDVCTLNLIGVGLFISGVLGLYRVLF